MSKRKLLLADDSVTVQKVVNLAFESEDIEVITADNGNSAFEKLVEFSPDLVMADINLPGADGYEICYQIKQDEETKHIPVILLVGSFAPFSEEKAERVGAEGFLKKPFQSIGLLINKVTELLERNERTESVSEETGFNEADTQPMPVYDLSETSDSDNDFSISDELGETGMDDEMIETERVADYPLMDETSKYETVTGFDAADQEDSGKTRPMIYSEIEELGLNNQTEENSEQTIYELADEPDDVQSATSYDFGQESDTQSVESPAGQADSYEDYSSYGENKTVDFPASEEPAALELDDLELLELPPLNIIDKPFEPGYTTFIQPSEEISTADNSPQETVQEETAQMESSYSDYAEHAPKDSYSMPQTAESNEAEQNYSVINAEPTAEFNTSEIQDRTIEEDSETPVSETTSDKMVELETAEFAETDYSTERETETAEYNSSAEEAGKFSAAESEEKPEQNFADAEIVTPAEIASETQAMIAQETQQISQTSDNKVVIHYLPPEVIDEIAERVVEKLAEKLRR